MKKNNLTKKEVADLIRLLKKVRLPAPYPVFLALAKSVPIIAADVAIMPDFEHILLTHRKDEHYNGWHIPGRILLYGESIDHAAHRVLRDELNAITFPIRFAHYFHYMDKREHAVALLFIAKPKKKPPIGKYFHIDKIPKNFIQGQLQEIRFLKKSRRA